MPPQCRPAPVALGPPASANEWICRRDPKTGRTFWANLRLKTTQWECPFAAAAAAETAAAGPAAHAHASGRPAAAHTAGAAAAPSAKVRPLLPKGLAEKDLWPSAEAAPRRAAQTARGSGFAGSLRNLALALGFVALVLVAAATTAQLFSRGAAVRSLARSLASRQLPPGVETAEEDPRSLALAPRRAVETPSDPAAPDTARAELEPMLLEAAVPTAGAPPEAAAAAEAAGTEAQRARTLLRSALKLGTAAELGGELERAEAFYRSGLKLIREHAALSDAAPRLDLDLASVLHAQRRYDAAEALYQKSLERLERESDASEGAARLRGEVLRSLLLLYRATGQSVLGDALQLELSPPRPGAAASRFAKLHRATETSVVE